MDSLYPNLQEKIRIEGLCPICLLEMELAPRFVCSNNHTICYRCKPYYYGCPTCQATLEMQQPPSHSSSPYSPPPPTHFLPHLLPPIHGEHFPSAPPMDDFLEHERNWFPPQPSEDQNLQPCAYTHLGCAVKVPIHLADLHESRCQFRPHLEEELLPTDLVHQHDDLIDCKYKVVGCKVKTLPWRASIHENVCNYKERYEELTEIGESLERVSINSDENPEELVECKFRKYGCLVNMPRRRKQTHQEICNYRKYNSDNEESSSENEDDPEEQVPCKWADYGCRVCPRRIRLESHEQHCNYRMVECVYKDNGCDELIHPARKYAHEKKCEFAC